MVVSLICILVALATAFTDSLGNYVATFWSQDIGSSMTSLSFGSVFFSNLISVFILKTMTSKSVIYVSNIATIGSMSLIYAGVRSDILPLQIVSFPTTGVAMSCILPSRPTFAQEAVTRISGIIASALLFAGDVGAMVNPILLGYLMEYVTPMWYIYLSLLEAAFCFVIFTITSVITRKYIIADI